MIDSIVNVNVREKYKSYPVKVQKQLLLLRQLILNATDYEIEETLKWGEPSYLSQHGSTVRLDYKSKNPNQYALYFNCKSKLIDTFKELYGNTFKYQGNRALVFDIEEELNEKALQHCISLSLNYHKIKHLPLLGAY